MSVFNYIAARIFCQPFCAGCFLLFLLSVNVSAVAVHCNHRGEVCYFQAVNGLGEQIFKCNAPALFYGILVPPELRFDILAEIEKKLPGFPIVLHGASSVPQEYVKIINTHGGKLKDAVGIPEEQLRKAAKSAVCKINIDSDGRLAMTAAIRKVFNEKPEEFDPRKYLGPARTALKELYKHKNIAVLGSAGHAQD